MQSDIKLNEQESVLLAQRYLSELGFHDASIHHHHRIVRIQVQESDFDDAIQMRERIVEKMKTIGYRFVSLDLGGKTENPLN